MRPDEASSPERIIAVNYQLISGRADESRDWERWKTLFSPGARMIPIERNSDGHATARVMTPDEYIASRTPILATGDFYEWETARAERRAGRMAHVWSSYEAARVPYGTPIRRGVNSIQLWNDGTRWWILSVTWDAIAAAEVE